MRFLWYAGTSSALAAGVVAYAFNQRANFYSAMVYLSQNNLSLMILINLVLLVYGTFVYGLQRLCFGPLRPIEVEQLYEKAWFAVTETCLAMTIFREEVGAWFLVMFTALVTGKVWEWIGEGRVEILEQQPPANPRLFHTRLSVSLLLSVVYDTWLFLYTVDTVVTQARPNMMVMFLFEFAILTTSAVRTGLRYVLSLVEANIVKKQTRQRLEARRKHVRDQRAEILRRRESGDAAEAEAANQEELPDEDDVDEMDIEVPGWESKGQWVLSLDLITDFVKLGVYAAFFAVLMMFYGLPIHIMRDLFMTTRSFLKRLSALVRYRKALQDMNKYPDATAEDLTRENTCIICREDMRPWDPNAVGAIERSRPKKLPCGHILHYGCLKSWLERQQVCPTCRRSVVIDGPEARARAAAAQRNVNGQPAPVGQQGANQGGANGNQPEDARRGGMRMFQLGPLRLGIAQGNAQNIQEMVQRLGGIEGQAAQAAPAPAPQAQAPAPTPASTAMNTQPHQGPTPIAHSVADMRAQLRDISQRLQSELQALQTTQAEMQTLYALVSELQRLRQLQEPPQNVNNSTNGQGAAGPSVQVQAPLPPQPFGYQSIPLVPNMPYMTMPQLPPRLNSPSITRHTAVNPTPIPAGSPDLPEGVVIPQGWTLLPLQRIEGQPPQVPPPPPPMSPYHPDISHRGDPLYAYTNQPRGSNVVSMIPPGLSNAHLSGRHPDPPHLASPTPVAPNGAAQPNLFSSMVESTRPGARETSPTPSSLPGPDAPRGAPASTLNQNRAADTSTMSPSETSHRFGNWGPSSSASRSASTPASSTQVQTGSQPESSNRHPMDAQSQHLEASSPAEGSSEDKGKARAATVEDASEDDSAE